MIAIADLDRPFPAPVDAPTRTGTVLVTAAHIERGRPCTVFTCPIALAVLEALPAFGLTPASGDPVKVSAEHVSVICADCSVWGSLLPTEARRFIQQFDHGSHKRVQPFRFPLTLEQW